MVKYIFWAIVFYLLIRFIFNFVIPVFRATRQMRGQVKQFHSRMEEEQQRQAGFNGAQPKPQERSGKKEGDYIDFEEVK